MTHDRRFRLYTLFLAVTAAATIWIVGSGEATPHHEALWAQDNTQSPQLDRSNSPAPAGRETLYKYSKLLTDISYRIQSAYMDTINTKEMIYSGIRGMLDVLDPFSVLMEQQNYDRLMESTHGKYEGLGMQIDLREDTVTVVSPPESRTQGALTGCPRAVTCSVTPASTLPTSRASPSSESPKMYGA